MSGRSLVVAIVLAAAAASGCGPAPGGATAAAPARLYVVRGGDAGIVQVDPGSGRVLGALPVARGTSQVVPGRLGQDEGLVTLASPAGTLTHLGRAGGGAWTARAVVPEPGAVVQVLAGD